jgi:sortase A
MKDRRPVNDLSIEELERALAEKKRAAREARLAKYRATGRVMPVPLQSTPDTQHEPARLRRQPRSLTRQILDGLLLVVEIGAVLGLIYVLYNGTAILRRLNQEVAQVILQPTLSPTPLVTAVILPGGHTPPTSPGGAQFNEAEIPDNLRLLIQSMPQPVVPTPGPTQARRIIIPAIHVDASIVQGDGWEQLKKGVAQHLGTSDPGQTGKMVLSAHNDIFGEIFKNLDQLVPGDEIQLYTTNQAFIYVVTRTQILEPTEVSVMDTTPYPSLVLISCYPYLVDNQRIAIFADWKSQ